MNIIEAIKELKEGRCEGIKLGDFKIMMRASNTNFTAGSFTFGYDKLISEDWEMIGPVKQYEEVEIVRYIPVNDGKLGFTFYDEPPKGEFVKLTGTIKKEIKPKTKHREEVGLIGPTGTFLNSDVLTKIPRRTKIFAEWVE